MSDKIKSGYFRIVSCTEGKPPLGIGLILPGFQFVRADRDGSIQQWVLRRREDGKLLLGIGGYSYTGIIEGKVAASVNLVDEMAWEFRFHEHQSAYTIVKADDTTVGWTVASDKNVEIQPIKETRSLPPQYSTAQLFTLEQYE